MTDIVWEEPPPARPQSGASTPDADIVAFADALRTHPQRWARYPRPLKPQSALVTARQIARGLRGVFAPAGTFETATRTVDGARVVYVRYVGPS